MPWPEPFHLSHSVDYIYYFCPVSDPDVGPSILVRIEHTLLLSILVCAAKSLSGECPRSVVGFEPGISSDVPML